MRKREPMQLGMIGLGRMGANMVRRLMRQGHECVVYDVHAGRGRRARQARAPSVPTSLEELRRQADEAARDLADGAGGRGRSRR